MNKFVKIESFHEAASIIFNHMKNNRGKFENGVLLKSIEREYMKRLLKFNEVLARIIMEMKEGFHFMNVFYKAKNENVYRSNRGMLELLRSWVRYQEDFTSGFNPNDPREILLVARRMKQVLRDSLYSFCRMHRIIYYEPGDKEKQLVKSMPSLDTFHESDRIHICYAYLFSTTKHEEWKGHDYLFLTFDKSLGRRGSNFNSSLGKLAIMYYETFLSHYNLKAGMTPQGLLIDNT